MKGRWYVNWAAAGILLAGATLVAAQPGTGHHHGGGFHEAWPDSLETVTLTGTVIVDSTFLHPVYYLDEDGDGVPDTHLSFGPWWYEPESGATRPAHGETVIAVGTLIERVALRTLVVFEINGVQWREPVLVGRHGWMDDPMWITPGDTLTATGIVLVDTTYFYAHYFLDTDGDSVPEYKLGFGPPWYEPESGATRPDAGDTVTVVGPVHEMAASYEPLVVYEINGLEWRPEIGPAPWAGTWMRRDHADTTYVHCVTDSLSWIAFPPGHMGGRMGGMMWPESLFVQFWEVYPDSLPGPHLEGHFMGFYLDAHDPFGHSMMGREAGWGHGIMRFNMAQQFRFHYEEEILQRLGVGEDAIRVHRWDPDAQQWTEVEGAVLDPQSNTATFASSDLSNYYALFAPTAVTGVETLTPDSPPARFLLYPNYPNPFNPATTIRFDLPARSRVRLAVYNLLGQRVALLVDETREPGAYTVRWDGRRDDGRMASSGVYLLRLESNTQTVVRRMTLLK